MLKVSIGWLWNDLDINGGVSAPLTSCRGGGSWGKFLREELKSGGRSGSTGKSIETTSSVITRLLVRFLHQEVKSSFDAWV